MSESKDSAETSAEDRPESDSEAEAAAPDEPAPEPPPSRKRMRSSSDAIHQALRLIPFVLPYKQSMMLLILASLMLAASESGRNLLIEPLMNQVFLVKTNAREDADDHLRRREVDAAKLAAARAEALKVQLPDQAALLISPDLTLGPPLGGDAIVTETGAVLDRTRRRLLAMRLSLQQHPELPDSLSEKFRDGVRLQRTARARLTSEPGIAVALSLQAREASHELNFATAWTTLRWIVFAALGFAVVVATSQFFAVYLANSLVARVMIEIQNRLAEHLLRQELAYFEGTQQGEFFSRLTNDVGTTQIALNVFFTDLAIQPLKLIALFFAAVYFSPTLSLSLVVLGATVILPIRYLGKKIRRRSRKRQQSAADALGAMQQMLSGIRVVKAFHREDYESARFRERTHTLLGHGLSVIWSRMWARAVLNLTNNMTIPLVFLGGGLLVLRGTGGLTPGSFAGFVAVVVTMYAPAKQLAKSWTQLQDSASGIERIFELLDRDPKIVDSKDAKPLDAIKDAIVFDGVNFSYDGEKPILKEVAFTAKVGTQTAIVGATGHGKSTLLDLLPKFIVPDTGAILIDGVDLQSFTRESLLDSIAVVTQDAFLFNDTIANNIRYGRLDASMEEIKAAAKKAQIHDEILNMPDGYDTMAGERGSMLSGGQKQRVTIARALLRNPKILILDEATSGLDTATERAVQAAIDELTTGRTSFTIAHRLSTIRNADQILVLHEGRVVEQGTYDELVEADGLFTGLARAQSLEQGLADLKTLDAEEVEEVMAEAASDRPATKPEAKGDKTGEEGESRG